ILIAAVYQSEDAGAPAVRHLEQHRAVAELRFHRLDDDQVRGEGNLPVFQVRGFVEVDDGPVPRIRYVDAEENATGDAFVGPGLAEGPPARHRYPGGDLHPNDFCPQFRGEQRRDEQRARQAGDAPESVHGSSLRRSARACVRECRVPGIALPFGGWKVPRAAADDAAVARQPTAILARIRGAELDAPAHPPPPHGLGLGFFPGHVLHGGPLYPIRVPLGARSGGGALRLGIDRLLWSRDLDDAGLRQHPHYLPGGIDLEPARGEVRAHAVLVVIVLEELAHGEDVEGKRVARLVAVIEALVTVFVSTPVDD